MNTVERIKYLRKQLSIHTYLYDIGMSMYPDSVWDSWAYELVELQRTHPEDVGYYDEEFRDFDGHTGMGLPRDSDIIEEAEGLM